MKHQKKLQSSKKIYIKIKNNRNPQKADEEKQSVFGDFFALSKKFPTRIWQLFNLHCTSYENVCKTDIALLKANAPWSIR